VRLAPFLPAAALLAIWVAWIPADGGYFPRQWLPAAMFSVALLAAVAVAGRRALPAGRWARAGLGLLAAATAWSFVSMLWAETDGRAWEASDQLLLYLAMAWLVALVPWRPGSALGLMGVWSVAVAVACAGELISALSAAELGHYLIESRWQQPTGYANGAAAIAAMAAWPALVISARRGLPAPVQVGMAVVAVFLLEMAVLPQSRAMLVVAALILPLLLALSPDRGRLLGRLLVVALAFVVAGDAVWDVYGQGEAGRPLAPALDRAAEAMALGLGAAAAAAVALVIVERRVRVPALPRPSSRVRWSALAAVLAAAAVAGVAGAGTAADYADERWEEFKSEEQLPPDENASRIAQRTSDKRYDYWRVSLNALADAPVGGVGAGGFEREYTEHRRYPKPSQAAHSIWMRALSETGAVGAALLAALVAALAGGLLAAWRRGEGARAAAAAAAGAAGYFLLHASFDWLELFPALAAPALGFAFAAVVAGGPARSAVAPRRGAAAAARAGLAAVLGALAVGSLALPYLSIRHVDSALARPAAERDEAERELDRAADLDPLSPEPHLARGALALRRADFAGAERAFRRALEVEDGWYPHFELALLASRAGRMAAAREEIERARRLNPPDLLVREAARLIGLGKRIDPRAVDRDNVELRLYNAPGGH
jgi:tetratricopeptide (TPR) repeat protein